MATVDDVLNIARSQIGTVEVPNNKTKYGAWYGLDGNPWCAMFVSWCFAQAGMPLPASTSKGFAYCPSGVNWFKKQGRWSDKPVPGAIVFYNFGQNRAVHVGIVESVGKGFITTIEGNTSSGNSGSQTNGGGVYRRNRASGILGYGLPYYSTAKNEDFLTWLSKQPKEVQDYFVKLAQANKPVAPAPAPAPTPNVVWKDTGWARRFHVPTSQGSSNKDAVRHLQTLLGITVDGSFGPQTRAAVVNFQKNNGLGVDGIVGAQTWAKLHPTINQGTRGHCTAELQTSLGIAVDDVFGPQTNTAVRSYQSAKGLAADGVVGFDTWHSLF